MRVDIDQLIYSVTGCALAHELQLVNYLTATGIEHGLLLNFGSPSLQHKHKFRTLYRPKHSNPVNPAQS